MRCFVNKKWILSLAVFTLVSTVSAMDNRGRKKETAKSKKVFFLKKQEDKRLSDAGFKPEGMNQKQKEHALALLRSQKNKLKK